MDEIQITSAAMPGTPGLPDPRTPGIRMQIGDQAYRHIIQNLEQQDYATIKLDPATIADLDNVTKLASHFFAKPAAEKQAYALPSCVEGYRAIGQEYALAPDRPDLTESFSFWYRNRYRLELADWQQSCPLHPGMRKAADRLSSVADGLLTSIAEKWSTGSPKLRFRNASYLQVNYYEPAKHQRDLLQDPHEDGHLITLVRASEPGLEIRLKGRFTPVELAADEMLIMPGSLLSLMTGNVISPLYHQVRNSRRETPRYSLMFFVDPEIDQKLEPWLSNSSNAGVNIIERAISAPQRFGLPSLVDGANGQGKTYAG